VSKLVLDAHAQRAFDETKGADHGDEAERELLRPCPRATAAVVLTGGGAAPVREDPGVSIGPVVVTGAAGFLGSHVVELLSGNRLSAQEAVDGGRSLSGAT
jgi:hypothetical protein